MKTIGIVGSRRRSSTQDCDMLEDLLWRLFEEGDRIVSGGCLKGADMWAEYFARQLGATILIHHANWEKHGKAAGIMRNTLIAKDCDVLLAVVAADRTGGTEDTIKKARKLNKPVWIIGEDSVKELKPRKKLT